MKTLALFFFCVCNALKIKHSQAILRNILFCSLGEVGGAGAEPPQNLPTVSVVVQTVLLLEWSRRKRGQDCQILFSVFGGEMATAKIQTVKGLRVEIFSRPVRKNTSRPLTVWIVGHKMAACFRWKDMLYFSEN